MPSYASDLAYLVRAAEQLQSYLLSDVLFWPLSGSLAAGTASPSLTLGGLLLARTRLSAWRTPGRVQGELTRVNAHLDSQRDRWKAAWEKKALQEYASRLRQWQNALMDYRRDPEGQAAYYPQDVKARVYLELLGREIPEQAQEEQEVLLGLDRILRAAIQPGDFVWEAELASGFPQDRFWYLYGRLRESSG